MTDASVPLPLTFHALYLSCATPLLGDVRVPTIISDNMVLQAETRANVWGWADPSEKVTIKFGGKSAETVADGSGKWVAKLEELKSGEIGELTITARNTLTLKNVAVGEVWLGSGQSNMEWTVAGSKDPSQETAAANFPLIRMFTVQKTAKEGPAEDCPGKWEVCTPETASHFSAVAYYFGRKLHQDLQSAGRLDP